MEYFNSVANKIFNFGDKSYKFINCKVRPNQQPCKWTFANCLQLELTNSPQVIVVYSSLANLQKLEIT